MCAILSTIEFNRNPLVAAEGDHGIDSGGAAGWEPGCEQGHGGDDDCGCGKGPRIRRAELVEEFGEEAGADEGYGHSDGEPDGEEQ